MKITDILPPVQELTGQSHIGTPPKQEASKSWLFFIGAAILAYFVIKGGK